MKKLFFLIFSVSLSISAWAYDFESGGIYYNITSPTTVCVTHNGSIGKTYWGDVVIPETVNHGDIDYVVSSIGERAFCAGPALTSVTLPGSITSIGDYAFESSGLSSISIPANVTSIGEGAFGGSGLTSIIIPDNVESIGDNTFSGCYQLTSVTLSDNITSIGNFMFAGCELLTSITIPNSVTNIGERAFGFCPNLQSITIPASVVSIAGDAFYECSSLTDIYMLNTVPVSILDDTFTADNYNNARLHVPQGKAADYRNAEGWKNFVDIVDDAVSGIGSSYLVADAGIFASGNKVIIENARLGEPVFVYDASGRLLKAVRVTGERSEIRLPMNRIYVIKCANKVEKIKL